MSQTFSRFDLSWIYTAKTYYARQVDNTGFKVSKNDINKVLKPKVVKRIETPYLILTALIAIIDSNKSNDYSWWGRNSKLVRHIAAASGVYLRGCEVIKNMQRLAADGFITINYNPSLSEKSWRQRYDGYPQGEVEEQPGVFIDYDQENYRLIRLNMDVINKVVGAVDEYDPYIQSLPARSRLRKFFYRKPFVNINLVKKGFRELQKRAKENDRYLRANKSPRLASASSAFALFIKNYASKFVTSIDNKLLTYRLYANKSNKGKLQAVDDDTGEIIDLTPEEMEQAIILNDLFERLK